MNVLDENGLRLFVNKFIVKLSSIFAPFTHSHEKYEQACSNIHTHENKQILDNIPFKFGIDKNGNYGYIKAGADTVTPF